MPNSSKEFINYLLCTKCGMATVDRVYEINSDGLFTRDRFLYLKCPECGAKYKDLVYKAEKDHIVYAELREYEGEE